MADEFYSFAETVEKLGISDDELTELVSNDAIPMQRAGRKMKFKVTDVEAYLNNGGAKKDESRVIELDEIPDDIELVGANDLPPAEDSGAIDFGDDEIGSAVVVSDEMVETDDGEVELAVVSSPLTFDDAEAEAVTEAVEPVETVDDLVVEEPAAEIVEEVADDLVVEEPAEIMTDETMAVEEEITDDATMEVSGEDVGDETVNTQDVTINEEPITEDEIAADSDEAETMESEEEDAAASKSSRMTARSSMSSRNRFAPPAEEGGGNKKDIIWLGALAALAMFMIYPTFLVGSMAFYGIVDQQELIEPGRQKLMRFDGLQNPLNTIGEPVIPKMFAWIKENKAHEWFGIRKTKESDLGKPVDKFVKYEERNEKGLMKEPVIASVTPATEEPATPAGDDENPDEPDEPKDDDAGGDDVEPTPAADVEPAPAADEEPAAEE